MTTMTIIYDVLLQQRRYKPVTGYYGEPKYICIFYDEDKNRALKEMRKYVKKNGFDTDGRQSGPVCHGSAVQRPAPQDERSRD